MAGAPVAPYRPPTWFDRRIFNPLVARLSGLGLSVAAGREFSRSEPQQRWAATQPRQSVDVRGPTVPGGAARPHAVGAEPARGPRGQARSWSAARMAAIRDTAAWRPAGC